MTLVYISGSPEKSGQGSCGASTLRGGHCHDLQHSGACQTLFPWPQTRHLDPRSIRSKQCTMPQDATNINKLHTNAPVCNTPHSYPKCIYITTTHHTNI